MTGFERWDWRRVGLLVPFLCLSASVAFATPIGSIFVTGHDPDFHASEGPNTSGSQNIIDDALTFVRNGSTEPILLIESNLNNLALGDHTDSEIGLVDSGYSTGTAAGSHYVKVDSATFSAMSLAQLEAYSAIFIPSDHGGTLTEQDLAALDSRASDLLTYLNAGGGLFAMAEDGNHSGGSGAPLFGFLPFLATSTPQWEMEAGNTVTSTGLALGLTGSDINGNFSHNIFTSTGGMKIVDQDANGEILSLAYRGQLTTEGVPVPEPTSLALLGGGLLAGIARWRRRGV